MILSFLVVAEGFLAPDLSLLTATSILVEWEAPLRPNGVILSYHVTRVVSEASPVTTQHGLSTSAVLSDLAPFSLYLVTVGVTNTQGIVTSPPANVTTGETGTQEYLMSRARG